MATSKTSQRKKVIIIAVIVVAIILFDVSPIGGNFRFYAKWIECGQRPVATNGPGLFNTGVVHYYKPELLTVIRGTIPYYCTPLQAEQAGYSASPDQYEFRYLH